MGGFSVGWSRCFVVMATVATGIHAAALSSSVQPLALVSTWALVVGVNAKFKDLDGGVTTMPRLTPLSAEN